MRALVGKHLCAFSQLPTQQISFVVQSPAISKHAICCVGKKKTSGALKKHARRVQGAETTSMSDSSKASGRDCAPLSSRRWLGFVAGGPAERASCRQSRSSPKRRALAAAGQPVRLRSRAKHVLHLARKISHERLMAPRLE